MNESPDPLDRLLDRAPAPPAPPWFEQRLMARLCREQARPWWQQAWARCSGPARVVLLPAGAAALLALGFWLRTPTAPEPAPLAQDEFNQAFDAFVAYSEHARSWNLDW